MRWLGHTRPDWTVHSRDSSDMTGSTEISSERGDVWDMQYAAQLRQSVSLVGRMRLVTPTWNTHLGLLLTLQQNRIKFHWLVMFWLVYRLNAPIVMKLSRSNVTVRVYTIDVEAAPPIESPCETRAALMIDEGTHNTLHHHDYLALSCACV